MRYRKHYLQVSRFTESDRYPDLFRICRDYFAGAQSLRILSWGCSTGEEVLSLCSYMPHAFIVGADINPWCISKCGQRAHRENAVFMHSLSHEFKNQQGFNAIFCMAVFQDPANRHSPDNQISKHFYFQKFEEELKILDQKLLAGGLLFIENADFNFLETVLSDKYSVLMFENNIVYRERPLYSKKNIKVSDTTDIPRVFIKNS